MYTLALIQFLPVLTLTTTSSVVVETISNLYFIWSFSWKLENCLGLNKMMYFLQYLGKKK